MRADSARAFAPGAGAPQKAMNRLALSPSFATTIDSRPAPARAWFARLRGTAFGRALIGSAVIHALLIAMVPGFRQALPHLPLPERLDVLLMPRADVPPPLAATTPAPQPQTRAQPQTQRADQRPIQRRVEARAPSPRMPAQRIVSAAPSPVEPAIASPTAVPAEPVRSREPMPEALKQVEAEPPRPASSVVAPRDGLIAAYGSGFKAAVDKNRRYPRIAQARGWQGTATVLVKVLPGGRLGDVSIARSSGVDLLDDTARDMVKTAQLPALPEALRDHAFEMRVPVEFRLL